MRASILITTLGLAACGTGPDGPPGEGKKGPDGARGPAGDAAPASLSFITPDRVLLGRHTEVSISGSNTHWSAAAPPVVDFGVEGTEEVQVDAVTVHSPTSLTATVTVPTDAAIGLRDVVVTDENGAAEISGAFSVDPSLDAQVDGEGSQSFGHLPQGSIVLIQVSQLDLESPFDLFPENVQVTVGDGSPFHPQGVTTPPYGFGTFMRVDVKAQPGAYGLVVDSGPPGRVIRSATARELLKIEERVPTPLQLGDNVSGLPSPLGSLLFRVEVDKEEILKLAVSGSDPLATADVIVLPASGRFSDLRNQTPKFANKPVIHMEALVQPPEAFVIYRGFGNHAEPHIGIEVSEALTADAVTPLSLGAPIAGSIVSGDAVWYAFTVDQPGQLTLELTPGAGYSCGSPTNPLGMDSELQLLDSEGRDLASNDDSSVNWCSSLSYTVEPGSYHARVASSQRFAPLDGFDFTLVSELQ